MPRIVALVRQGEERALVRKDSLGKRWRLAPLQIPVNPVAADCLGELECPVNQPDARRGDLQALGDRLDGEALTGDIPIVVELARALQDDAARAGLAVWGDHNVEAPRPQRVLKVFRRQTQRRIVGRSLFEHQVNRL